MKAWSSLKWLEQHYSIISASSCLWYHGSEIYRLYVDFISVYKFIYFCSLVKLSWLVWSWINFVPFSLFLKFRCRKSAHDNIFAILTLQLQWKDVIICASIIVTLMHQIYEASAAEMGLKHSAIYHKTRAHVRIEIFICIFLLCSILMWYKLFVWKLFKSNFHMFPLQPAKIC